MSIPKHIIVDFLTQNLSKNDTNLAIFPYGELGKNIENCLIQDFHIFPRYIFDNSLFKSYSKILPSSLLKQIDYKSIDKIIVCSLSFNDQIISSIPEKWSNKIASFSAFCNLNRTYNRELGKDFRANYPFNIELSYITSNYLLNKIKENEVKQKVINKIKVRVMFLVDDIAKFKSRSVYHHMKNSNIFEPFILVFKLYNVEEKSNREFYEKKHQENLSFFKENGYTVYDAHDNNGDIKDLEEFYPDIIFTSSISYIDSSKSVLSSYYLYTKWLVCYLNYGINSSSNYNPHFNNSIITCCWKHFEVLKSHFSEIISFSRYSGINTKYLGNPFLDDYESTLLTNETQETKSIVIYAPHWTINVKGIDYNSSTFMSYSEYIYELAKANKNVCFIFKPHPGLKYLEYFQTKNSFLLKNYISFTDKWNKLCNCKIYEGCEYIPLFKKASLLITDCYSFIGEWLPSNNPCIYLTSIKDKNKLKQMFDPLAIEILDTYYIADSPKQITHQFRKLIIEKKDPQKEKRKQACNKFFNDIGGAGQRIVKYLEQCLQ